MLLSPEKPCARLQAGIAEARNAAIAAHIVVAAAHGAVPSPNRTRFTPHRVSARPTARSRSTVGVRVFGEDEEDQAAAAAARAAAQFGGRARRGGGGASRGDDRRRLALPPCLVVFAGFGGEALDRELPDELHRDRGAQVTGLERLHKAAPRVRPARHLDRRSAPLSPPQVAQIFSAAAGARTTSSRGKCAGSCFRPCPWRGLGFGAGIGVSGPGAAASRIAFIAASISFDSACAWARKSASWSGSTFSER